MGGGRSETPRQREGIAAFPTEGVHFKVGKKHDDNKGLKQSREAGVWCGMNCVWRQGQRGERGHVGSW